MCQMSSIFSPGQASSEIRSESAVPAPRLSVSDRAGDMVPDDRLLTPAEVASLFGVDPRTVTRWATSGRLTPVRTPGGHRRYRRSEVLGLRDSLMA
jgi:excisionase family DNA binding protein